MKIPSTYGAEIEKAVSDRVTGQPHGVSQQFFARLAQEAKKRNDEWHYHFSDVKPKIKLGVVSAEMGEQGLDNGFNLLETAIAFTSGHNGLEKLGRKMTEDLGTTQKVLAAENATVINMSNHPMGKTDEKTYWKFVAPKGMYSFIRCRGWDHAAGIDANAQNCPTTGISVENAASAFAVMMGASAAIIALYANSPYDEGGRSPYKESRLSMWNRMFGSSTQKGDLTVSQFPPYRFRTLAQYFNWMHSEKTSMHFIMSDETGNSSDYKGIGDRVLVVKNNPPLLNFLSKPKWEAMYLSDLLNKKKSVRKIVVQPNISHLELHQWTQFAGVRIRYGLQKEKFPPEEFVSACRNPKNDNVEKIFAKYAKFIYIEGRDPGANFPDSETWNAGTGIARSVVISPAAFQAGLLRNLKEAAKYIDSFNWNQLHDLRKEAILKGLQGRSCDTTLYGFTKTILDIAGRGLSAKEQKFLAYPEWVLKTKKNGADRAIEFVENYHGSLSSALKALIKSRSVIVNKL